METDTFASWDSPGIGPDQLSTQIHHCYNRIERLADLARRFPELDEAINTLTPLLESRAMTMATQLGSSKLRHLQLKRAGQLTATGPVPHNSAENFIVAGVQMMGLPEQVRAAFVSYRTAGELEDLWTNELAIAVMPKSMAEYLVTQGQGKIETRPLLACDDTKSLTEVLLSVYLPSTMTLDDALAATRACLTNN
jgi:hypothetical protein